jgi:hypothetical protein
MSSSTSNTKVVNLSETSVSTNFSFDTETTIIGMPTKFSAESLAPYIPEEDVTKDIYLNSPFYGLKRKNPKTKGKDMEDLVEVLLAHYQQDVRDRETSASDRTVNGFKAEIKGSFLYAPDYKYFKWQQIRNDQDYDWCIFLAFYPEYLEVYACTKEDLEEHVFVQNDEGHYPYAQHGGKKAVDPNTFALQGVPTDFSFMKHIQDTPLFVDKFSMAH